MNYLIFFIFGVLLGLVIQKAWKELFGNYTDVNDVPRDTQGWYFLAEPPTIIVTPKGCEVHIVMRGQSGYAYRDCAYWTKTQLTKRGKKIFTAEEAYEIAQYAMEQHQAAHGDHA